MMTAAGAAFCTGSTSGLGSLCHLDKDGKERDADRAQNKAFFFKLRWLLCMSLILPLLGKS